MIIPSEDRKNQTPISRIDPTSEKILAEYDTRSKTAVDVLKTDRGTAHEEEFLLDPTYSRPRGYYQKSAIFTTEAIVSHKNGLYQITIGHYEEGLKAFERATDLDPSFASAWNYEAICYTELRNYEEAIRCFAHFLV